MNSKKECVTASVGVLAATLGICAGCGRQAIATTDALPVQRVVIYRNGIAYFEQSGHVDRDEVRFKMKGSEVGDFLATLAVMEQGGTRCALRRFLSRRTRRRTRTIPVTSQARVARTTIRRLP